MRKEALASAGILLILVTLFVGYQRWRVMSAVQQLKHEDVEVRDRAAARLAETAPNEEAVIDALVEVFVDERFSSATVAHSLEKIGAPAIPTLLKELDNEASRRHYWGSRPEVVTSRVPRLFES